MYCRKCGVENEKGAKFCKSCGEPMEVENFEKRDSMTETVPQPAMGNRENSNQAPVKNNLPKISGKWIVGIGAVVALAIVMICIVNHMGKKVDLNDYITVSFEGYDTCGTAKVDFDTEAFKEKYQNKVKADDDMPVWTASLYGDTPIERLATTCSLSNHLDKQNNLANGNTITLKWSIDAEDIKNKYGLTVKAEEKSYTVEGLQAIETFDPFEGVEVNFSGVSPYGQVEVAYPEGNGLDYSIDNNGNLKNGEKVTVTVSYGWSNEENYIEQYGKKPNVMSKKYTVEGLDEYISDYAEIPDELKSKMKKEAEDIIVADAAKNYDAANKLGDIAYVGYAFCAPKDDAENFNVNNCAVMIYKGTVTNAENAFSPVEVYFPVVFNNLLKNKNETNYESCDGIRGRTELANGQYSVSGYTSPTRAYIDLMSDYGQYDIVCGDGYEVYCDYELLTDLNSLDDTYLQQLQTEAQSEIENYILQNYDETSHCNNLVPIGQILLVSKETHPYPEDNNAVIIVYQGELTSDEDYFEDSPVYFPVIYDGIIRLSDNTWETTKCGGILGHSTLRDSYYSTDGYIAGSEMYTNLVTALRDEFTCQVSDGLKGFEE